VVEGHELGRLVRTSTSKDYVLGPASVNFAADGRKGGTQLAGAFRNGRNPGKSNLPCPKSFSNICLQKSNQAAWGAGSSSEPLIGVKYLSKVLIAASKTMWQSEQESKCRLISVATGGESLPSKYQQIKWIVSRQLMTAVPPWPRAGARHAYTQCI
jgi:hypothetical protein